MQRVVRAFPVLPGKAQAAEEFARELSTTRSRDTTAFYRQFGVTHESWYLQETPAGPWIIAVTEISDLPVAVAAERYAGSTQAFDSWFKQQVRELCGINPDEAPLGPPTRCILSWSG